MSTLPIELQGEVWKPLEAAGFEGIYFISDHGRVKNRAGEIKKAFKIRKKYVVTMLNNGTKHSSFALNKVVAEHFLSNPEGLETVTNLNGDLFNNHYLNLRWEPRKPVWNKGQKEVIPVDLAFKIKTSIRKFGGREELLRSIEKSNRIPGYYYRITELNEALPGNKEAFLKHFNEKSTNYTLDEVISKLETQKKSA